MADDFASATPSAAAGGNTMVLPFALQEQGTSLRDCVEAYRKLAESECYVDTAFHLIISDPTAEVLGQELPALLKDGYTSFKVFMTYEDLVLSDHQLLEVFDVARREDALVMVHGEGYDAIRSHRGGWSGRANRALLSRRRPGPRSSSARRRTGRSAMPSSSASRS